MTKQKGKRVPQLLNEYKYLGHTLKRLWGDEYAGCWSVISPEGETIGNFATFAAGANCIAERIFGASASWLCKKVTTSCLR